VALSGTQAPGQANGVLYADFYSSINTNFGVAGPAIGDQGQASFYARLIGGGITPNSLNGIGVFQGTPGNVAVLAQGGSPAVGAGAGQSIYFNPNAFPGVSPPTNNAGAAVVHASMFPKNGEGLWYGTPGALTPLALTGQAAPGMAAGTTMNAFSNPIFSSSGQAAFGATLAVNGQFTSNVAVWSGTPGNLALVAASGQPAPGTSTVFSQSFGSPAFLPVGVNNSGQVAFQGLVAGLNPYGLWSGAPGQVSLVARVGAPAPSAGAGVTFGQQLANATPFSIPDINTSGQVAFAAAISGNAAPYPPSGVWAGLPNSLTLVAKTGGAAPGLSPGTTWAHIYDATPGLSTPAPPLLNEQGKILLQGSTLPGPGGPSQTSDFGWGLWAGNPGSLSLVAHAGLPAPGEAATFQQMTSGLYGSFTDAMAINDAGQVAFTALLSTSHKGIWATNTAGVLTKIAVTGELLQVAPGDSRTIQSLVFLGGSGGADGRGTGLNDSGQISFWAGFGDGTSGIFISNAVAVPEPGTAILAFIGLVALFARKRIFILSRRGLCHVYGTEERAQCQRSHRRIVISGQLGRRGPLRACPRSRSGNHGGADQYASAGHRAGSAVWQQLKQHQKICIHQRSRYCCFRRWPRCPLPNSLPRRQTSF